MLSRFKPATHVPCSRAAARTSSRPARQATSAGTKGKDTMCNCLAAASQPALRYTLSLRAHTLPHPAERFSTELMQLWLVACRRLRKLRVTAELQLQSLCSPTSATRQLALPPSRAARRRHWPAWLVRQALTVHLLPLLLRGCQQSEVSGTWSVGSHAARRLSCHLQQSGCCAAAMCGAMCVVRTYQHAALTCLPLRPLLAPQRTLLFLTHTPSADYLSDKAWVCAFEKPKGNPAAFVRPATTVLR